MGGDSLDVHKPSGLDVLHKEVAQSDVLRALVEPSLLLRLSADVLSGKMWIGDVVEGNGFIVVKVVRLY